MDEKKMKSPTALLGHDDGEQVEALGLRELIPFQNHPFQVNEDSQLSELKESIARQGVATPIIVRPKGRGTFEIISGHRRVKACQLLGLETIPAFIRDLDDDAAILFMVDTNIQRESLLYSEKAFAYKMKMDALKRQGKRNDLSSSPVGAKSGRTDEQLAQENGESKNQIHRYIRLTELSPDLLALVDRKKLPFQTGVELSYLNQEEQVWVWDAMQELHANPSLEQAGKLKRFSRNGALSASVVLSTLDVKKSKAVKLSLKADMREFFPRDTSAKEMEAVILGLLQEWKDQQQTQHK